MENLSIIGLQWGDEGKGKIVDYHAGRFDGVARYNGGSNAGHTIVFGNRTYVFHLLPSGLLKRKRLFIGPGVVLDPITLKEELDLAKKEGIKIDLTIDGRCTLVSPLEKEMDAIIEKARGPKALGTTKRGIGPAYAMRALRVIPRAMDLGLGTFDLASAKALYSLFAKDIPDLTRWTESAREVLRGRIGDVGAAILELNASGKSVIFEGAQGVLLDLIHGTYPYVTGGHTLASYVPASLGIPAKSEGKVLGVAKAYTTRVGSGPFPTEISGRVADSMREIGKEYGATTGRPRRIGWFDLVAMKYAVRLNGVDEIALTKLDILTKVGEMKVCVAYRQNGREITEFSSALPFIDKVLPVYEDLQSFLGLELTRAKLPRAVDAFVEYLERELKVKVSLVSIGEERTATVERG
ncbi:MAG: adenylosuccinate synthase [Thaumarchaeota archaeon]|nr:adenylosuccinate synthase [Nitrososphaerota archaeon]